MALASTIAGIAFSGAGVHIPHALAYPIASLQHEWRPPGMIAVTAVRPLTATGTDVLVFVPLPTCPDQL